METKLPAKEGMGGLVAPYGPKEVENMLASNFSERMRLELHNTALKIVNPQRKDLTVLYPSSGSDVMTALDVTRATTLHLADKNQQTEGISKNITDAGGRIQKVSQAGDKTEIDFEWDGKNRKVIFHHVNIDMSSIDKLLADVGQYDIYFEKRSQSFDVDPEVLPEIMGKFIGNLKIGGHAVLDYQANDHIGLEKEQLDSKYDTRTYPYGDGHMRIHRKKKGVHSAAHMINFNKLFSDVVYARNGGSLGVDDKARDLFKEGYEVNLRKLREAYETIPQENSEERANIRAEIKKDLYDSDIDKSKVLDSKENLHKQMEDLIWHGKFVTGEEDDFLSRAVNPTEQQLKDFREEGRKIFERVFPDLV
jgi:hypothetical protein